MNPFAPTFINDAEPVPLVVVPPGPVVIPPGPVVSTATQRTPLKALVAQSEPFVPCQWLVESLQQEIMSQSAGPQHAQTAPQHAQSAYQHAQAAPQHAQSARQHALRQAKQKVTKQQKTNDKNFSKKCPPCPALPVTILKRVDGGYKGSPSSSPVGPNAVHPDALPLALKDALTPSSSPATSTTVPEDMMDTSETGETPMPKKTYPWTSKTSSETSLQAFEDPVKSSLASKLKSTDCNIGLTSSTPAPPVPQAAEEKVDEQKTPPSGPAPAGPQDVKTKAEKQRAAVSQLATVCINIDAEWQKIWSAEHLAYYYWHVRTDTTTWKNPLEEGGLNGAEVIENQSHMEKKPSHYLCVKHWEPITEVESAMALIHGERVELTWTDGTEDGWAYGMVSGEKKQGYFPRECIAMPKRLPCNFILGEAYKVSEHFEGPARQGGYMSVAPGDIVTVLHQDKDASTWVYAGRHNGSAEEVGWLPEAVLSM